ncbi:GumC family protein [Erythrobacter litoralis]|uniref:Exopolysaccharide biosynthesis protein n=1 Tax=Erythrobacter litoralis (strain HTCC2594) TaxID=314225 RepID=Q2N6C2_ERYLH|nr:polysaccharide biosynthesis tyrosine autokinase [Erythrobacter litoralis]ABC64769.1 exopolysaccharide biosynthesis protein [Erythrobacter litoralis HTCC2594]
MNVVQAELGGEASPVANQVAMGAGNVPMGGARAVLRQYINIVRRWRWVILGVAGLCIVLGLIATLLATPLYTATSTIEISRESSQVTDFQGVERETSVYDQEFYQTQYGLLEAESLAERVVLKLRLVDDPEFYEMFGVVSDSPAFTLVNGRYPSEGRADRMRVASNLLLSSINIDPARLSRLVNISFTSPQPEFSARVANAWAESFIQANLDRKVQATSYGRDQLEQQLTQYKEQLDESQRQLVAYAANEQIINLPSQTGEGNDSSQDRSLVVDQLASLNQALSRATADRIQAESRARQTSAGGASTEALVNPALNNLRQRRAELAAEYGQLMVRFEPGYPAAQAIQSQLDQIDQAIAAEESRISRSLGSEYRAALAREQSLRENVAQLKNSFLDLQRRSIQYNIYQQEVDTNRELYDGLLQRFKEIGVAGGIGVNNIAIIDLADVPQSPSSPNLILNMLISLVLGMGLGAGIAYLLELNDESIADPEEVTNRLDLALLGTIPISEDEEPKEALLDPKSDLVDAYLAIQTSLALTTQHGLPKSLTVTSTRPAEGKSTTSLALAALLARSGKKVILIDGDMRSPSVHHLIGTDNQHGLSNFLSGEDSLDGMVLDVPKYGMSAMSSGPIPPNAAELLSGDRLTLLLDRLLETYDHVIIDSPPVMGLADAPLIASRVEAAVYVIESHGTKSVQIKTAVGRLRATNARILGAVLTKYDNSKAYSGYNYDYGYGYGRDQSPQAA